MDDATYVEVMARMRAASEKHAMLARQKDYAALANAEGPDAICKRVGVTEAQFEDYRDNVVGADAVKLRELQPRINARVAELRKEMGLPEPPSAVQ